MSYLWHNVTGALIIGLLCLGVAPLPASTAEPIYFYASQSGKIALDQGEGGGNPFASALVELLARDKLNFKAFRTELVELTEVKSKKFQRPEVSTRADLDTWQVLPKPAAEKRVALVVVFSDYSSSKGAASLPGAKHDLQRVAVALEKAGFQVQSILDPDLAKLELALKEFAGRSAASDVAVLYTTGHGVEVDGTIYLLPGDYPIDQGSVMLKDWAIRLTTFGSALRASRANLVFYGGCRNNPFGKGVNAFSTLPQA